MYKLSTLNNGLTLIAIDLPFLDSVTTMVAVGAGSRYESGKTNGISHFLEHMFFKGSKKYPTAEMIATMVDSVGAVNNAFTHREFTGFWVKSAARHVRLASDIISSQLSQPLFEEKELEMEKGVIVEEMRMYKDAPGRYIYDLFTELLFGDTPLGRHVIGDEETIKALNRQDLLNYVQQLYSPKNLALVFAGKIGNQAEELADEFFSKMPKYGSEKPQPFVPLPQLKPKVNVFYKDTDQAHVMMGGISYSRTDEKRYAATLLASILGEGMSSRLFTQIRQRRGWAYRVAADTEDFLDTGTFIIYAGLKIEKAEEGVAVIKEELERLQKELVADAELEKVKEMERGHLAIREESTNFLAEYYGLQWVLDHKIETPKEYLEKITAVTAEDIKAIANELFIPGQLNLQIIAPFKDGNKFEKILIS